MDKSAELRLESTNRTLACCFAPVARHLLSVADRHDPAMARRAVGALLSWSAALGSADARDLLAALVADGTLAAAPPLPAAKFTDLPPWLKE